MNEEKVINILMAHFNKSFPKKCSCCHKVYNTYHEFLLQTKTLGNPIAYDEEFISGEKKFILRFNGTLSLFNCSCGTTLALSTKNIGFFNLLRLMYWGRKEAKRRNISTDKLIIEIRNKVRQKVLEK